MTERGTLFCLHSLGASAAEFDRLRELVAGQLDLVALDLPGFGARASEPPLDVSATADLVIAQIAAHGSSRWALLGHSMGGKISTLVAARTLAGTAPVFGLRGIVLLAASPPTPEPMQEDRRRRMIAWADGGPVGESDAAFFIDQDLGADGLDADDRAAAIADVRRASPEAWRAWLATGSRVDISEEVGTLDLPALVVAGGMDGDLGVDAQRRLHGGVYPRARFEVVPGAAHQLPRERPAHVARLILHWWRDAADLGPTPTHDWARIVAGSRVSTRTRGILARRALADDPGYVARALEPEQLVVLRRLAARVLPVDDGLDLAQRLDRQLAAGEGDGWRDASLPPDARAYRLALAALAPLPADDAELDDLLDRVAAGEHPGSDELDGARLATWFDDLGADLVRLWLAHPAAHERIGYDGFATGGDEVIHGFLELRAGAREAWEPERFGRAG